MPKPWFCPSLTVPDDARAEIKAWVDAQSWPEGTKLKDPDTYHITVMYSPTGYGDPAHHEFFERYARQDWRYGVRVQGVEVFSPGRDGRPTPVVLELHGILLKLTVDAMLDEAEKLGFPVSRFGQYRPHITVAEVPSQVLVKTAGLPGPDACVGFPLKFETGGKLIELHAAYDAKKATEPFKV